MIACCPPCTEFSRALTTRPRRLEAADRLVQAALEIIDYLQPTFWFLENPRYGELRDRVYMKDIPFVDVDYCQFSTFGYRKPTRIWGTPSLRKLQPRICDNQCPNMEWGPNRQWRHKSRLGGTPDVGQSKGTQAEAYRVPADLIKYIVSCESELQDRPEQPIHEPEGVRQIVMGKAGVPPPPPFVGAPRHGKEREVVDRTTRGVDGAPLRAKETMPERRSAPQADEASSSTTWRPRSPPSMVGRGIGSHLMGVESSPRGGGGRGCPARRRPDGSRTCMPR